MKHLELFENRFGSIPIKKEIAPFLVMYTDILSGENYPFHTYPKLLEAFKMVLKKTKEEAEEDFRGMMSSWIREVTKGKFSSVEELQKDPKRDLSEFGGFCSYSIWGNDGEFGMKEMYNQLEVVRMMMGSTAEFS